LKYDNEISYTYIESVQLSNDFDGDGFDFEVDSEAEKVDCVDQFQGDGVLVVDLRDGRGDVISKRLASQRNCGLTSFEVIISTFNTSNAKFQ
jgi:hypothetical protein